MSKERKRDQSALPRPAKRAPSRGRKLVRTKIPRRGGKSRRPALRPRLEEFQRQQREFRRKRELFLKQFALPKPGTDVVEEMKNRALDKHDANVINEDEMESLDYEKLRSRLELAHKKIRKLEEEGNTLKQTKDQTMRTIENLLSQNRELTSEVATLRDQQRKDTKVIDGLRKTVNLLEARMQKIKEENKILNENNLKAMKELQIITQEKSELNKSYKGQYEENKKLIQDKESVANKLQTLENRFTKVKTAFEEQNKMVEGLKFELNKHKQSVADLKKENTNLKNENVELKNKLQESAKSAKVDTDESNVKSPVSNRRRKK